MAFSEGERSCSALDLPPASQYSGFNSAHPLSPSLSPIPLPAPVTVKHHTGKQDKPQKGSREVEVTTTTVLLWKLCKMCYPCPQQLLLPLLHVAVLHTSSKHDRRRGAKSYRR